MSVFRIMIRNTVIVCVRGSKSTDKSKASKKNRVLLLHYYTPNYSLKTYIIMAMFQITTKNRKQVNGIRIEPGMSVQVVSQSLSNPVTTNGGQSVIEAFYRIYGIDIKKAGCLNMADLNVDRIG